MQILILLLFWFTFGALTALLANSKGRDPRLWFFIGVLLGIGGVIIALLLPKKIQKQKEALSSSEKISNNSDTEIKTSAQKTEDTVQDKQWYYLDQFSRQNGPLFFSALKDLYDRRCISESTFIWTEGMDNWKKFDEHPDLQKFLS